MRRSTFNKPMRKTHRAVNSDNRIVWTEKKPEPILDCACGRKYIKTRRGQKTCIFCIYRPAAVVQ